MQAFAVVDSVSGAGMDTLRDKLISLAVEQKCIFFSSSSFPLFFYFILDMGEEIPQNYISLQEKIKVFTLCKTLHIMLI